MGFLWGKELRWSLRPSISIFTSSASGYVFLTLLSLSTWCPLASLWAETYIPPGNPDGLSSWGRPFCVYRACVESSLRKEALSSHAFLWDVSLEVAKQVCAMCLCETGLLLKSIYSGRKLRMLPWEVSDTSTPFRACEFMGKVISLQLLKLLWLNVEKFLSVQCG